MANYDSFGNHHKKPSMFLKSVKILKQKSSCISHNCDFKKKQLELLLQFCLNCDFFTTAIYFKSSNCVLTS